MGGACPTEQVIDDFMARRLDAETSSDVEEHLDRCAACRELISTLASPSMGRDLAATRPIGHVDEARAHGRRIGRFSVVERLGAGGMGVVYAAHDPVLDRRVALKLLHSRADAQGTRLLREAQALARLSHPNVVAVYDVGAAEGQVFVAMELIEGTTLSRWLALRPRTWREVVEAFVHAGRGLIAAHEVGFVHRDFKPDNVLVHRDGRVVVTDFGLARFGDEPSLALPPSALAETVTMTGALVGTPAYMAPEQLAGAVVDARADQFAFCVALFEALHGVRPYSGATVAELGAAIAANRRNPARRRIPTWLSRAVARGLEADPDARFPSLAALIALLDRGHPRRSRIAFAAGTAAMLATATWLVSNRETDARPICHDAATKLTGIWDPARKQVIRAALTTTGQPHADATWLAVERVIDVYARDWAAMHDEACAATAIRHEQSAELLDLRMLCLADRRTELETLSALLADADAALADRAVRLTANMSPIATCADAAALRAPGALPSDPAARAQLAVLSRSLAEAKVLRDANRRDEARANVEDALTRARSLRHAPTVAEALFLAGSIDHRAGALQEAEQRLGDAVLSAEAGRADRIKVQALTELVDVYLRMSKLDRAHDAARQAAATIARLGGDDLLAAGLDNQVGNVLSTEGKFDEALARFRAVVDARTRAFGRNHADVAVALNNIGATHVRRAEFALAEPYFREALQIEERLLGPDHPDVAGALSNLAICVRQQGRLAEAQSLLERALAVGESAHAPPTVIAAALTGLGNLALEHDPTQALRRFRRAHALLVQLGPERVDVATVALSIGSALFELERLGEARASFEEAARVFGKTLGTDHPEIGRAFDGIAAVLAAEDDHRGAIRVREQALALRERGLPPDHPLLGLSRLALAEALWEVGQRDRARKLARRAKTPSADAWLATH